MSAADLRPEDLPRLSDEEREAADSGYVAIEGVPVGDEPAHTKGQWEAEFRTDRPSEPGYWVVIGDVMRDCAGPVADTLNRHHCITPEEDEANARLIATAPRMLAKLKQIAGECCNCDGRAELDGEPCENCKDVREVVAAAEGKQP
jgi:hypothetical protein